MKNLTGFTKHLLGGGWVQRMLKSLEENGCWEQDTGEYGIVFIILETCMKKSSMGGWLNTELCISSASQEKLWLFFLCIRIFRYLSNSMSCSPCVLEIQGVGMPLNTFPQQMSSTFWSELTRDCHKYKHLYYISFFYIWKWKGYGFHQSEINPQTKPQVVKHFGRKREVCFLFVERGVIFLVDVIGFPWGWIHLQRSKRNDTGCDSFKAAPEAVSLAQSFW